MAVTALIKFTQGANTDVPGRAVLGDTTSGGVAVTNGDNTNVVSWEYELLYVPPGSAEPLNHQGPNATPTFAFGQPDVPGSYRVRLTVRDIDGNKDIDIRNFVVPFPNRGLIAPPYQGNPIPLPLVAPPATTPAPKPDEMNIAGQAFGWSGDDNTGRKLLYLLIAELDSIVGAAGTAGGDLSGTYPNPTVAKLQTRSVSAAAPSTNDVLQYNGTSWAPSAVALAGDVTGPFTGTVVRSLTGFSQNSFLGVRTFSPLMGDDNGGGLPFQLALKSVVMASDADKTLSATELSYPIIKVTSSTTLTSTRVITLPNVIPGTLYLVINSTTGGQSLLFKGSSGTGVTVSNGSRSIIYNDGTNYVAASDVLGTAGGDLSGTYPNPTVAKVNGTTYGAGGSLTTGQVPRVTGASTTAYGALDLANANAVTGLLPDSNQAAQTMGGDCSGTTSSCTVGKVKGTTITTAGGSLTTGHVLRVTGTSTADWGALDLANTSAVTGVLPSTNRGLTVSPSQITSNQNDYNPTNFSTADLLLINSDSTLRRITGFDASPSVTKKIVVNTGSDPIIIAHQDTGSSANNRVICPNAVDYPLMPGGSGMIVYDSAASRWRFCPDAVNSDQPVAVLETIFSTGTGNVDATFTLPASPSGNGRFLFKELLVRSDGIGGGDSGNVVLSVGTTAGGQEYMTNQTINSGTTGGVQGGLSIASLGTSFTSANGYRASLNASAAIVMRAASTATVSSSKKARCFIYGSFLP